MKFLFFSLPRSFIFSTHAAFIFEAPLFFTRKTRCYRSRKSSKDSRDLLPLFCISIEKKKERKEKKGSSRILVQQRIDSFFAFFSLLSLFSPVRSLIADCATRSRRHFLSLSLSPDRTLLLFCVSFLQTPKERVSLYRQNTIFPVKSRGAYAY